MSDPRIDALQAAVDNGTATGNFPLSLLAQYNRRGYLSDKQWPWVERLAQPAPAQPTEDLGSFAGVIELFSKAREHLKFPKIWLRFGDNYPLRLNVAGPASKYAGCIQLTDGGGYHEGTWYGRVSPEGQATFSRKVDDEVRDQIVAVLRRLAEEPAKVAAEYGALTGNCCFCSRPLSDERSTEVGYGETCAGHYGLPWGKPKLKRTTITPVEEPRSTLEDLLAEVTDVQS